MRLLLLSSLLLAPAALAPAASAQSGDPSPVRIYTECIGQKADGTYFAWFGYANPNIYRNPDGSLQTDANGNPTTVKVPVGFENGYGDSKPNGQTTTFKPGPTRYAHRLDFTGREAFMQSGTYRDGSAARYSYWYLRTPGQSRHRTALFYDRPFSPSEDGACLYDSFADVSLDFELSDPSPEPGQQVEGTITLRNSGTIDATVVHVQKFLPKGMTLAVAPAAASGPNPSVGRMESTHWWTVDRLEPGQEVTLRVLVSADAEGSFSGYFDVECQDQEDPDSRPANHNAREDDYAGVSFTTESSSSGTDGGLESDGALATLLARRDVDRMIARADAFQARRAPAPLVMLSRAPQARTAAGSDLDLRALLPETGPGASTAYVTTPEDLVQITNARAILAADYVQDGDRRVGAMLAVMTPAGETYDHTKAICDRVKGSRLSGVRTVDVEGARYVLLQVDRPDGSVDYAITVVAYPENGGYTLDSRFRAEEYEIAGGEAGQVLNVQTWASTPEAAVALVREMVRSLDGLTPLEVRNWGLTMPTVPDVYVEGGEYAPGRLVIDVANTTGQTQTVQLTGTTAATEVAGAKDRAAFTEALTVPAEGLRVEVPTGAIFDAGFSVVTDGDVADYVYLADGVWTYTSGDASDDLAYSVAASGLDAGFNRRPVERDARLAGTAHDWAGLFRSLQPGSRPVDLTGYSSLVFRARGAGRVQVVVEKTSTNGVEPYHTWIDLTDELQTVAIPFAELTRDNGQGGFTAEDVTLVAFYTRMDGAPAPFEIDVRDMRFENTNAVSTDGGAEASFDLAVTPNPSRGAARVQFSLAQASDVSVEVYDLLGRRVAQLASGSRGAGEHTLELPSDVASGTYLVRLRAGQETLVRRITRLP